MQIQIRSCAPQEQVRAFEVCEAASSEELRPEDAQRWAKVISHDRTFVATEGEEICGAGGNLSFELTVPAGRIAAAGVTMIGVLPTHRRRGILTKVMRALHEDAARRGEPVAILWASEAAIYQRFGYGFATKNLRLDAPKHRVTFREAPRIGQMRMIERDTGSKLLPEVYERVASVTPGMLQRDETWWEHHRLVDDEHSRDGKSKLFCGVLEVEGRLEGYALYRSESRRENGARPARRSTWSKRWPRGRTPRARSGGSSSGST